MEWRSTIVMSAGMPRGTTATNGSMDRHMAMAMMTIIMTTSTHRRHRRITDAITMDGEGEDGAADEDGASEGIMDRRSFMDSGRALTNGWSAQWAIW